MKGKLKLKRLCFVYITLSTIFIIIYNSIKYNVFKTAENIFFVSIKPISKNELKYILQWTSPTNSPFVYMGVGRDVFIKKKCAYTNCYVTSNRNFFNDYTRFDAIVFAGPEIVYYWKDMLPTSRLPHQKYVYANIESAAYYPVCTNKFDKYFNWTWTYRLDSDLRWGYLVIRNSEGKIVGPNKEVDWINRENMRPVSEKLLKVLRGKTKAAAWFVSNCFSLSNRESFVIKLDQELKSKYNLSIDVYGKCGSLKCSRKNETACNEIIRQDYFFYLSFENAICEEYVTEKLLHAVQFNAIPIVFGGANYSSYLPDRSYLNAREMEIEKLAEKMHRLMTNFSEYVEYFKWTNHYSYHRKEDSVETDDYCQMCALLNNKAKVEEISAYDNFGKWWNLKSALCYDNIVNYML